MADYMKTAAFLAAARKVSPTGSRHRRLVGAVALLPLMAALTLGPALAQDFTVEAGTTVGQQTMNQDYNKGVIEAGGTVHADGVVAVVMSANDQMLENFGIISTTGDLGNGIYSNGGTATISNFGTISTTGFAAYAIFSLGPTATITNSGAISTTGGDGFGIASFGENATITNSGTISTTGLLGYGIYSTGLDATIINSGTVSTTGTGGIGIWSGGPTITNSGTISTTELAAFGIYANGDTARITNSGTITTTGISGVGIYSNVIDATITNSGTIISEQSDAINFTQSNSTLNLLAGSVIQGGVTFTGSGNTVSFGPGINALMTFSVVPDTILTSGNPYAVDGTTVAVLDRGGFALTDDMALALASEIAGMTGGHGQCLPAPDGQLPTGDDACATEAWLSGFGGFGGQPDSSDLAGYDYLSGGALAGLEFTPGGDVSGGIFLGSVAAQGSVGESQDTTQTGGVVGGHAGFAQGGYFADFYSALGVLQIDSERTVADNTVDGGLALASASEVGYFFSPAVTVGTELETGAGILTPSLRLRYTGLMLDGYAESGADDAVVIDERVLHELELRAQLALALTPDVTEDRALSAVLRAGADISNRQADITGELLGQDIAFTSGADGTAYRGFAALDLDLALGAGTSLFGNMELGLDSAGGYSAIARAGLGGSF